MLLGLNAHETGAARPLGYQSFVSNPIQSAIPDSGTDMGGAFVWPSCVGVYYCISPEHSPTPPWFRYIKTSCTMPSPAGRAATADLRPQRCGAT